MKCKSKDCKGEIDEQFPILLVNIGLIGVAERYAYPCKECGLLHWDNGDFVSERVGEGIFFEKPQLVCGEVARKNSINRVKQD